VKNCVILSEFLIKCGKIQCFDVWCKKRKGEFHAQEPKIVMSFSVHLMIIQLKSLEWKLRNASYGLVIRLKSVGNEAHRCIR